MEKKEDWRDYDSYILSITWSPSTCFNKKKSNRMFQRIR